jgi:hypothetical protein
MTWLLGQLGCTTPAQMTATTASDQGTVLPSRLDHVRGVDVAVEVPVVVLIHGGFLLLRIDETSKGINQSMERRK